MRPHKEKPSAVGQRKPVKAQLPTEPADGIDLESERGHDMIDFIIEEAGMLTTKNQIVKKLVLEYGISRAQGYRYYDYAWKRILDACNASHEEKIAEARSILTTIVGKASREKKYDTVMSALDRRNLIDKVSNPTSSQKITLLHGDAPVDSDLPDDALEAIARAGAISAQANPPDAPAKGGPSSGDSAKAKKGAAKSAPVSKGDVS